MKLTSALVATVLVLCAAGPAMATSEAGVIFLLIPVGARGDAMGRSFIGLADDGTVPHWNPANLGWVEGRSIAAMHTQLVPGLASDVYYEYLGYVSPMEGGGGWGANIIFLTLGRQQGTDIAGNPTTEWNAYDISGAVSYGTMINEHLAAGGSVKAIYSYLAPLEATQFLDQQKGDAASFAIDFGVSYRHPERGPWWLGLAMLYPMFPNPMPIGDNLITAAAWAGALGMIAQPWRVGEFTAGAVIQNFGPDLDYVDAGENDPLPLNFKLGFARTVFRNESHSFKVAADINKLLVHYNVDTGERDSFYKAVVTAWLDESRKNELKDIIYGFGAEYQFGDFLSLRAGYVWDEDGQIIDPTWGGGIAYESLRFDLAVVPQYRELELVKRFSLSYQF
jgi:hypothetical protein